MRTKALLLTAALGVAGAATSMAQVYSVNAVGYINRVIYPGFNMVANQLITADNSIGALMPNLPENTTFYGLLDDGNFEIRQVAGGAFDPDGNPQLGLGRGCFLLNQSGAPFTITFVGEVPTGTLTTPIVGGAFSMRSSQVPQAGGISSVLGFPLEENTTVYVYKNGPGGELGYDINSVAGGAFDPNEPTVEVGEAFYIFSPGPHPNWVRVFNL